MSAKKLPKFLDICFRIFIIFAIAALFPMTTMAIEDFSLEADPASPTINRFLEGIDDDNNITGWAWNPAKPNKNIEIYFYADGTSDTGQLAGTTVANQPGDPQNHRVKFFIPQKYKDGKAHLFYGYTKTEAGKFIKISGSPVMYPNQITSAFYGLPNYPQPKGWAADNINYFKEWSCSSSTGIDTINRLNISPLSSHHPNFWKDSLWINGSSKNGLPVIYYTASMKLRKPKFSLKKASYDKQSSEWIVEDMMSLPFPDLTGVSSQDGKTEQDYVLNEYQIAGWGPTANKPGSQSKIPGLANTPNPPGTTFPRTGKTYPLVGTGPLGITTITNLDQKRNEPLAYPHIPMYHTCRHANPTLFNYDSKGIPHSMMVSLAIDIAGNQPCQLPPGAPAKILEGNNYVYRYQGTQLGWQLDLNLGPLPGTANNNYKSGSNGKFLIHYERGDKIIKELDITTNPISTKTILNCQSSDKLINMGEIAGDWKKIVFLGDAGNDGTLAKGVGSHDIYLAYNSSRYTPAQQQQQIPSDLNSDGVVNIFDYNILVNGFGDKYNIFDYNELVNNYGK